MSLGRSDVLAVTRIAPILASANCSTIHSGTLVAQSTTRSPGCDALRDQPARDEARFGFELGEGVARPVFVQTAPAAWEAPAPAAPANRPR